MRHTYVLIACVSVQENDNDLTFYTLDETYLSKHVTRRKSHFLEIRRVPCRENDATVIWAILYFVNYIRQLIEALARIVGMHVGVPGKDVLLLWKTAIEKRISILRYFSILN